MQCKSFDYDLRMTSKRAIVTGGSGFIGEHLIRKLLSENFDVLNLDIKKPSDSSMHKYWKNLSILESQKMQSIVVDFDPNYIIHLAAVTTQNTKDLASFEVNIQGTLNVIESANTCTNLSKFIFASTQHVHIPGWFLDKNGLNGSPYGFYGESKLIGERMLTKRGKKLSWTIIRPTLIWGPGHPTLIHGLWKQILNGRYLHPKNDNVVKSYGYVANTVWQIHQLLMVDVAATDRKTFYLGDENLQQKVWVDLLSQELIGSKVREVPRFLLLWLSKIGQLFSVFGLDFPMYPSRYHNLVTSNPAPLDETIQVVGTPPTDLATAVTETTRWIISKHLEFENGQ